MSTRRPLAGNAALRWDLAGVPAAQGTMFETVRREVGTGEYRGMEFLHVEAKKLLNEVKGSGPGSNPGGLPFRWTVNPYRGCSHACSYCISGDTPVLMADDTHRPIADLRPGDRIYGTEERGAHRRYVPTEVLDHWRTEKEAWRITLADDTVLVASGDHRFLTERGWKHVAPEDGRFAERPIMATGDHVQGVGSTGSVPSFDDLVASDADLRIVDVERLGITIPMYDITTGTGDFIANGVVSHNCFARPTHTYLGLDAGADFDQRVVVKVNAVERLRAELRPSRWSGELVAMGTNTDPYQRCEGKYRLTRGLIEVLIEAGNPFSILTKSTLILRDQDLLAKAAKRGLVQVSLSVGTVDEEVWRATEPGTPPPARRLRAVEQLNAAGIPTGVLIAPILPGVSDSVRQLEAVAKAVVASGARTIGHVVLHLRSPETRAVYLERLAATHPEVAAETARRYRGSSLPKADRARIAAVLRGALEEAGGHLGAMEPVPPPVVVDPPVRRRPGIDPDADQLTLL